MVYFLLYVTCFFFGRNVNNDPDNHNNTKNEVDSRSDLGMTAVEQSK